MGWLDQTMMKQSFNTAKTNTESLTQLYRTMASIITERSRIGNELLGLKADIEAKKREDEFNTQKLKYAGDQARYAKEARDDQRKLLQMEKDRLVNIDKRDASANLVAFTQKKFDRDLALFINGSIDYEEFEKRGTGHIQYAEDNKPKFDDDYGHFDRVDPAISLWRSQIKDAPLVKKIYDEKKEEGGKEEGGKGKGEKGEDGIDVEVNNMTDFYNKARNIIKPEKNIGKSYEMVESYLKKFENKFPNYSKDRSWQNVEGPALRKEMEGNFKYDPYGFDTVIDWSNPDEYGLVLNAISSGRIDKAWDPMRKPKLFHSYKTRALGPEEKFDLIMNTVDKIENPKENKLKLKKMYYNKLMIEYRGMKGLFGQPTNLWKPDRQKLMDVGIIPPKLTNYDDSVNYGDSITTVFGQTGFIDGVADSTVIKTPDVATEDSLLLLHNAPSDYQKWQAWYDSLSTQDKEEYEKQSNEVYNTFGGE